MSMMPLELPEECPKCGSNELFFNDGLMLECKHCTHVIDMEQANWNRAENKRKGKICEF